MSRLFSFLLKLAADEFYGDVRIRFQRGKVHGQIEVHAFHLEDTLPQVDMTQPANQKRLAETLRGVEA